MRFANEYNRLSTIEKMQRLLAILLLSVIGFLPVGSALADASVAANLPACCRLAGRHHCTMPVSGGNLGARSKLGVRSRAESCPFVPAVSSAAVSVSIFPAPDSGIFFQMTASRLMVAPQSGALFQVTFDRNGQKRGPPFFLW